MLKKDFVEKYYEKGEFASKAEAERKIAAFLECVEEVILAGDEISFLGFGKFCVGERSARTGRNPQTGEEMEIPAKKVVKFKPGKSFNDKLNK